MSWVPPAPIPGALVGADPWWWVVGLAWVTALGLMLGFKMASPVGFVRRAKDRVAGHILEMVLFGHDPVVTTRALVRAMSANLRYLAGNLLPVAAGLPLFLLVYPTVEAWVGYRPLRSGEDAVVAVEAVEPSAARELGMLPGPGLEVVAGPVRDRATVYWRIRAAHEAQSWVELAGPGGRARAEVMVSREDGLVRPVVPGGGAVRAVDIGYPSRTLSLLGARLGWLSVYLILVVAWAVALKGPLKVTW